MRLSLFDYQTAAVESVLNTLYKQRSEYEPGYGRPPGVSASSLSACTGAGKTVIASAVIETLLRGSTEFNFLSDPTAVVLWLTDDESLNNQTRNRMLTCTELSSGQLVSIDTPDFPEKFDTGTVYFLNVQKLYPNASNYTQRSDARPWTLWDTINNTINASGHTLYLILDEAHKGMKNGRADKRSTALSLINGADGRSPVPIVFGISATLERFTTAMNGAQGRTIYAGTEVSVADVQESGLLKDTVILTSPDESGVFDTTLLAAAVSHAVKQTERWKTYCEEQGIDEVVPLLVVQVGDKMDSDLSSYLKCITDGWNGLDQHNIRHVFGEHKDVVCGGYTIRHIEPERVQDASAVKVLFAKTAVNTGWDCPRAEVLFSERGGKDRTHITQLLGRMVRTPLARRVPSDENLNAVMCLLPKFDSAATSEIVTALTNREFDGPDDGTGGSSNNGSTTVISGASKVELRRNTALDPEVFEALTKLPSEVRPASMPKPLNNLSRLATALCGDAVSDADGNTRYLRENAISDSKKILLHVLTSALSDPSNAEFVKKMREDVETADVKLHTVRLSGGGTDAPVQPSQMQFDADFNSVDSALVDARKVLTKDIANEFTALRTAARADSMEPEFDASIDTVVVSRIPGIRDQLDSKARELTIAWLNEAANDISGLSDERKSFYAAVKGRTGTAMLNDVSVPTTCVVSSTTMKGESLPTWDKNLLCDENGKFPVSFNGWETFVVNTELARGDVIGWYRNPSAATDAALKIAYQKPDGGWATTQPDFVFFQRNGDGNIEASIVDPHGIHLGDSLDRLRGMATFAERYGGSFRRFWCLAEDTSKRMRVLDLKDAAVRAKVLADNADAAALFNSDLAGVYS